jgi:hypothetical protein
MTGSGEVTIDSSEFSCASLYRGRQMCRVVRTDIAGDHQIV